MTHASVFSGIGGPEVAATMLGWENLFHCEINPFGRRVLDYWYPNSKSYEDITTTDFTEWRGRVNVLTGGFPCQPFSYAGKRGGAQDDRYLWPYMFRCIDQIRPDWVVAENVAGILTMVEQGEVSEVASAPALFDTFDRVRRYQLRETFTLQRICDDLESHGYAVQPVLVPACGVGAPHRRDRVFIIGRRLDDASHTECERARSDERETGDEGRGACESRREGIRQAHGQTRTSGTDSASVDDAADTESVGRFDGDRQRRRAVSGRSYMEATKRRINETFGIGESGYASEAIPEDTMHSRLIHGQHEVEGYQWHIGNVGAGGSQRLCIGTSWIGDSDIAGLGRWDTFPSVSPVHRGNDGLPFDVDRLTISFGKWRTEALKAYGNAIVPQVMYEIFRAIQQVEQDL